jgi:hypothetical protein
MAYRAKLNSLQLDYMMHKTNFKKHNFFHTSTSKHKKKTKIDSCYFKFWFNNYN